MILDFSAFATTKDIKVALGNLNPSDTVNAGWIPPDQRETNQKIISDVIMSSIPNLPPMKGYYRNMTKAFMWECWGAFKQKWVGIHQITGSCVGAGGGNMLFSLACADVAKRGDRERVEIPFWLLPYGISRMLGGLNSRGDGSFGSTFAKAVQQYGHFPADKSGLPQYKNQDGLVWGSEAELNWSQGSRIAENWLSDARPFLVKQVAKCRSADDVRDALHNFYGVTCASNWGGMMNPPVVEGVLLNRRYTTWNHQMSVQGWWDHPKLGEIFYIQNQWGSAHGTDPTTGFKFGFWIRRSDMEVIVRQGETFAFSQFDGFPAIEEPLDFLAF